MNERTVQCMIQKLTNLVDLTSSNFDSINGTCIFVGIMGLQINLGRLRGKLYVDDLGKT